MRPSAPTPPAESDSLVRAPFGCHHKVAVFLASSAAYNTTGDIVIDGGRLLK
jgi:hypothetical protein